jgi:multimeric flavodoxin WrbA
MRSTIAVFASSRRNGNTGRIVDRIAGALGIAVVDLGEKNIAPYDYEHRNRGDDFEPLMNELLRHEQLIFASPVYWYAVAPAMKVFLDRISDYLDLAVLLEQGRRLRGKTAFVVCTSIYDEVPRPFIEAFEMTFDYLGMRYGGCAHMNCKGGWSEPACDGAIAPFVRAVRTA